MNNDKTNINSADVAEYGVFLDDAFVIMRNLYKLLCQMHKLYVSLLNKHNVNLTAEEWSTLLSCNNYKGSKLNQVNLAKFLLKDKTTITRYLNALERKKCVTRTRDDIDHRNSSITITDYGKEILKRSKEINQQFHNIILKDVTQEDILLFKKICITIEENTNV